MEEVENIFQNFDLPQEMLENISGMIQTKYLHNRGYEKSFSLQSK